MAIGCGRVPCGSLSQFFPFITVPVMSMIRMVNKLAWTGEHKSLCLKLISIPFFIVFCSSQVYLMLSKTYFPEEIEYQYLLIEL